MLVPKPVPQNRLVSFPTSTSTGPVGWQTLFCLFVLFVVCNLEPSLYSSSQVVPYVELGGKMSRNPQIQRQK